MMRNKEEIRLQRVVVLLCATLFAVFAFFFTAKYQSPLLELFYDNFATGKLKYNPYVAATIITAVLTLLALWLNSFTKFKREWTALSFLPSTIILAFITDIGRSIYTGGYCYTKWIVVFLVTLVVYALFAFVLSHMLFAKIKNVAMSASRIFWRNLVLIVIMFCLAGTLSNGEENFKREALIYSNLKRGKVEKALNVGYNSNVASKSLTAYRAYMLAANGMMGEKLFEYPQYHGSKGLMPATEQVSPLVPDSLYSLLGTSPAIGEEPIEYIERAAQMENATEAAKNYYLSALLLDRRLVDFVEKADEYYPDVPHNELPKHFREALYLYRIINGDDIQDVADTDMHNSYNAFKELEAEHEDIFVRSNYVRRKFGRTYWWYFLYGF